MSTTVVMTTLHYGHYQHNPTRVPSHFFTISVMNPAELPLSVLSCSISISTKSRLKIQNLFSNIEFNVTMLYIYIRFCSNFAIVAKIIAQQMSLRNQFEFFSFYHQRFLCISFHYHLQASFSTAVFCDIIVGKFVTLYNIPAGAGTIHIILVRDKCPI